MEKFGWAITYLLLAVAGGFALYTQAPAVQVVIGIVWVCVWGGLALVGGLTAALGVYRDYKWEAGGVLAIGAAFMMYATGLWYLAFTSENQPFHTASAITAISWAGIARFLYIVHVRHRLYNAMEANQNLEDSGH